MKLMEIAFKYLYIDWEIKWFEEFIKKLKICPYKKTVRSDMKSL